MESGKDKKWVYIMSWHLLIDIYKSLSEIEIGPIFSGSALFCFKKNNKTSFESVHCYAIPEHETPQPEMS